MSNNTVSVKKAPSDNQVDLFYLEERVIAFGEKRTNRSIASNVKESYIILYIQI